MFEHKIYNRKELEGLKDTEIYEIHNGIVVVQKIESHWIEFSVMDHFSGDDYKAFWIGCGTADPLRECRHSYFAEIPNPWDDGDQKIDGYIFYINHKQMRDAMDVLLNYFDMD